MKLDFRTAKFVEHTPDQLFGLTWAELGEQPGAVHELVEARRAVSGDPYDVALREVETFYREKDEQTRQTAAGVDPQSARAHQLAEQWVDAGRFDTYEEAASAAYHEVYR